MTRYLFLAASIAALSTPAFGQTIDEIVSVGTRVGTLQIDQITAPVTVISEAEIEARNADFLTDILRTVPGLSVSSSGGSASLTQVRMRGAEGNHTLILIDGVRAADAGAGEFDFAGISAANISRIEILRGEQSAIYGSDAIAGVINIITKTGQTEPHYSASIEAGSFDTLSGTLNAAVPIGDAALTVAGQLYGTSGFDISSLGDEDDGSMSQSLDLGLNAVKIGGVTLSAKTGYSFIKSEFDSFPQAGSSNNTLERELRNSRLDANFELAGFSHKLSASQFDSDISSYGSTSESTQSNINWAAKRAFGNHTLSVVAEGDFQDYARAGVDVSNDTQGVAADYLFDSGAFTASVSARQDFNSRFDDQATWRIGGGYALTSLGGRLRASVGTGVKNPTLIELFGYFPSTGFEGNANLKPETSLGYNLGYEQSFATGTLSVDYFKSELEDEIYTSFASFPYLPFNRETDSTREGFEIQGTWTPIESLSLRGSATALTSEENDMPEQRRPEVTASFGADWHATDALTLNLTANHTGEQIDTDFGVFQQATLDAYTLISANARYAVSGNFTLSLRGENLLDEDYQEVFGYQSQPRSVYLGLSADF